MPAFQIGITECSCSECTRIRTSYPSLFGASDGFDEEGYDGEGYDRAGYSKDGFNRDGLDENSCDIGGQKRNIAPEDLNLAELWQESDSFVQRDFRTFLRAITSHPDAIDDVKFCCSCEEPGWRDDMSCARGDAGSHLCESCGAEWYGCYRCGDLYPSDEVYTTLGEAEVCYDCRRNHYTYCDYCEGYYCDDDSDSDDHDHSNWSGCCESPQPAFTVRNDGCEPLGNDKPVQIALPGGVISSEGLEEISKYLRTVRIAEAFPFQLMAYDLDLLGDKWQTKEGNYAKRLSRYAYKKCQIKLTPEVMSQVGCIARDHSNPVSVTIDVTRELNRGPEYFYHDDSCWWGSYGESRCALKSNGGYGLRSLDGTGPYAQVTGRAWVMPLRRDSRERLTPTFDTVTPDAFVVFNGYGDLSGYAAPRIVAHMAGWTYRKIQFSCDPMYVNAGGYLVAPEEIAQQYTDGELYLTVSQHSHLFATEKAALEARTRSAATTAKKEEAENVPS